MYDAVNSIDHRFTPFAVSINAAAGASQDGVIVAAHDVLMHYFPLQQSTLDAAEVTSLAAIPNEESKTDGIAVGVAVAEQWLAIRASDGLEAPVVLPPATVRASGNRYPRGFERNRLWVLKKSFNRTPFHLRACCCRFVLSAFD
jgi:hypothetical protein